MATSVFTGALETICPYCRGEGTVVPAEGGGTSECRYCGGDGTFKLGNIIFPLSPVFHSYQIIEAIDIDEYNALTASQQTSIQLFLSTGLIDLGESTKARAQFFALFGEGTNTRTALLSMVS